MKAKKYLIMVLVIAAPIIYIISCNSSSNPSIANKAGFEKKLSFYKLFKGRPSELQPANGVELLELSSTLFTDYAQKQRLLKLPAGRKLILTGGGLPIFPEGTLLAKTFYYETGVKKGKKIMETRLLLFASSKWNVATYKWNEAQTEAFLLEEGATVNVAVKDSNGKAMKIGYHIPSTKECVSCHHLGNAILPIGPKVRNLNRLVARNGKTVNQLEYLIAKGVFEQTETATLPRLPAYTNHELPIEQRARAYMEVNCAHCHQPGGYAGQTNLNLDYGTDLNSSGINFNRSNIVIRMSQMGTYHMPKLGTTVIDREGLALINAYIEKLK
jgi:uncharacterized repeat protein (TIGR03806 family)